MTKADLDQLLAESAKRSSSRDFASNLAFFKHTAERILSDHSREHAETRVQILFHICIYCHLLSMFDMAQPVAEEAVALARHIGSPSLLRRSLNMLGQTLRMRVDHTRALEVFEEALRVARESGDTFGECAVTANVLALQVDFAAQREALDAAEHVLTLFDKSGKPPEWAHVAAQAYQNVAQMALATGQSELGLEAATKGLQLAASMPRTGADQGVVEALKYNLVYFHLSSGDVAKARQFAEELRAEVGDAQGSRLQLYAEMSAALIESKVGRHDIALTRLTASLEAARAHGMMYQEVLRLLVRAHEAAGHPEVALGFLRQLMDNIGRRQAMNLRRRMASNESRFAATLKGAEESYLEGVEKTLVADQATRQLWEADHDEMERLAVTAELKDDSTGEHSYRVGKLTSLLAAELIAAGNKELTPAHVRAIDLAARLHDIGKISVPDAVLLKAGPLTPAERKAMEAHTEIGAGLLSNVTDKRRVNPDMEIARLIARHHHERWDGNGYPDRLAGTQIPLAARITALADVFDALTHRRPYKSAWTFDDSIAYIAAERGRQFDPQLTDAFLMLMGRLRNEHMDDLDAFLGESAHKHRFVAARKSINDVLTRTETSGIPHITVNQAEFPHSRFR